MHEAVTDFDLRGLIENSLLEWDNRLSAVAVAGGCNFRCPFCHSWRYVTGVDQLKPLDTRLLFSLLERQQGWIDGVVFTGGEPTLQPGLGRMLQAVREYETPIKVHTNGTKPEVIGEMLDKGLVDCLALDYKAPFTDDAYRFAAGRDDSAFLLPMRESFRLAAGSGLEREYHTTLVPGIVTAAGLRRMGEELEAGGLWILQPFEPDDVLNPAVLTKQRYTDRELEELFTLACSLHDRVILKKK